MSRWFRFHSDALNNPKVQKLDGETFKCWVNLLCLASEAEGALPTIGDIAFSLRLTEEEADALVNRLVDANLLDESQETGLRPHNWDNRQYISDSSTSRTKKYRGKQAKTVTVTEIDRHSDVSGTSRERHGNVTVTAPDTEQNRADTEAEQIQRQSADSLADPPKLKIAPIPKRTSAAPSWESVNEAWKWYQLEYPSEVNSFTETQLFIAVMETEQDLVDLRNNLPLYKASQKWSEGFANSSENFLSKRIFKIQPKARDSPAAKLTPSEAALKRIRERGEANA